MAGGVGGAIPRLPAREKQKDAKADASWVGHETHGTRLTSPPSSSTPRLMAD